MPNSVEILLKYVTPIILGLYSFYYLPKLIYKIVQYEKHERKSEKEESFLRKNVFMMILNCLIIPFLICAVLKTLEPERSLEDALPQTPKFPKEVIKADHSDKY